MTETVGATPVYNVGERESDDMMSGGGFLWVFFLFFLLALGGNGGGFGLGGNNSEALTRTEMQSGFVTNSMVGKLDDLCQSISNSTYALNNSINQGHSELSAQLASCCCTTQKELLENRYAAERNTCSIVNAIHEDGEATRALINSNTMQDLRDRLNSANDALAQNAQSRYLLDQLGVYYQKPACNPYTAYNGGCGCSGGC